MNLLPNPSEQNDSKRLIITVLICGLIFVGMEYFRMLNAPAPVAEVAAVEESLTPTALQTQVEAVVTAPVAPTAPVELLTLENESYTAQISTQGGGIEGLSLKKFTKGENWFNKSQAEHPQYASFGWLGGEVPTENTIWHIVSPNTLAYTNSQGQKFSRTFTLGQGNITVTETLENPTLQTLVLQHYAQVVRGFEHIGAEKSQWINPFGPISANGGILAEVSYDDLRDADSTQTATGGWLGFTTQYSLTALLAPEGAETLQRLRHTKINGQNVYTALVQQPHIQLAPNQTVNLTRTLYVGPKSVPDLTATRPDLGQAVNYGWFHVLASPMHEVLIWLYKYLGNWGYAIIGLTVLLKILTLPLTYKSFVAMAKMKKIQPEMKKIQEKYSGENAPEGSKENLAREMMDLYKTHKVSPLSGCWPVLIQMPIFFSVYKLILISYEISGAPFALWIHDLSLQDPFYVLPVLMGASMWLQMRLNPQMGDPMQQKIMQWMPVVFTVFFLWFPAGLVLYWLTNNVVSIMQQYWILKRSNAI